MRKNFIIGLISLLLISCGAEVNKKRLSLDILENGKRGDVAYYEDKPFTGIGFEVNENSNLEVEIEYKDGFMDGISKLWWDNGNLKMESKYVNGKANGLFRVWHQNGQLMSAWNKKIILFMVSKKTGMRMVVLQVK